MPITPSRRQFITTVAAGMGAAALSPYAIAAPAKTYNGPNVIIVRFGGGVRRHETILDKQNTYSPYLHELMNRGTFFPQMVIDEFSDINTSHGEGTLFTLTGRYEKFKDVGDKFLGARFEAGVPTVFEYLRKTYDIPEHQTLIVNGEDRTDEEFYTFSNHHLFGVEYRSNVLSLYRYKTFLLHRQIEEGVFEGDELEKKRTELEELRALDYRVNMENRGQSPEIEAFWEDWRQFYGDSGFVNPRGDRLLTELTVRAIEKLRPKLIMINYNDPDYVHWGNPSHYTRGISIIDAGIQRLVDTVEADPDYRDNTVFVIVPDCGRDSNRMAQVPFQHHFGSKTSHEIFALMFGPGIAQGVVVDDVVQQTSIAATVGGVMGFDAKFAEAPALEQVFA